MSEFYDVAVLGGGPSGMAAALAAEEKGASVIIIEREERLGGILKQCVHDGFGLISTGRRMAGPEYAQMYIDKVAKSSICLALRCFVSKIHKSEKGNVLTLISSEGIRKIEAGALVLATGCRERTARQVFIHGDRPAGIYTAGSAQHYVNLLGKMPGRRCLILGSGDIGLIMARRLTLEGAEVIGVYEAKSSPSGLERNLSQCLEDFNIPLYLSRTVTRVIGRQRVEAVETARVDESMRPIEGTEEIISCDCLILSVGLIPENELAESIGAELDRKTQGPVCDQNSQTMQDGVFVCGNAQHVNDLVDYVSESGRRAGCMAAQYSKKERQLIPIEADGSISYCVPQRLDINSGLQDVVLFFRSSGERGKTRLSVKADGQEIYKKSYTSLRPPEMQKLKLDFSRLSLNMNSKIMITLQEEG